MTDHHGSALPRRREGIAVVAVTRGGATLAAEAAAALGPAAELHVAERWAHLAGPRARAFSGPAGNLLTTLFPRVGGIVVVLALGATVRLVAPLLSTKRDDPAVVVLDEAGRHAVSVVGGHLAGANDLANRVADAIGATPVVTTASEASGTPAIDLIGREHGWTIEALAETVTRVSAAAVNGEPLPVYQDAGEREWLTALPSHWPRLDRIEELADWDGPALIVTDRALGPSWRGRRDCWVVYRPRSLVLGVGCSTGVTADEIARLAQETLDEAGLSSACVAVVATIDRRLDEPGLRQFAGEAGLPVRAFSTEELASVRDAPTPSAAVAHHVGTPGVCEPAAILASEGGSLVVSKRKSARATVAVARRRSDSHVDRGQLNLVGLGPGSPDLLTPRARRALRTAEVIVGYRGYVEPLQSMFPGQRFESYELGQETERARAAIELAKSGRRVALVSSGDAGVYGMAGLVFELLGDEIEAQPGRTEGPGVGSSLQLEVVPGVTAANAAAALLGAPLMLDFAVISLSDLLVPWQAIERRLNAAASGDFVVVLYNPASVRRNWQLGRAVEILLRHRPPTTPVGLVTDAYRPDEATRVIELGELADAPVTMKTVLIVGNSATVRYGDRLVTRRGYLNRETGDRP
jgi:cobalt-precorrin 5A hydrolase / precorrin-3B C17-methyltransferase